MKTITMTMPEAVDELTAAGYSVRPLADSTAVIAILRRGDLRAAVVLDPDTAVPAVALHRTTPGTGSVLLFTRDTHVAAGRSAPYSLANAVGHGCALARQLTAGVTR